MKGVSRRNQESYHKAHELYSVHMMDMDTVHSLVPNISRETLERYRRQFKWDEDRADYGSSPAVMANEIRNDVIKTLRQCRLTGAQIPADTLVKLKSLSDWLDKKSNNRAMALVMMKDLAEFLRKYHPALAKEFGQKAFIGFSEYILKKYQE
jgi:hypothetical protein